MDVALEIKSSKRVHETDTKSLKILQSEQPVKRSILLSFEQESKILGTNIECLPWELFLQQLWQGNII